MSDDAPPPQDTAPPAARPNAPPPQDSAPPAARPTNYAHVAVAGGGTAMLANVIVWLCTWPIKPPSSDTAMSIAGLLTMAVGAVAAYVKSRSSR